MGSVVNIRGGEILTDMSSYLRKLADEIDADKVKAKRLVLVLDNTDNTVTVEYIGKPVDPFYLNGVLNYAANMVLE